MAIDYTVELECSLKRHLGPQGLVDHLKRRMVLDLMELLVDSPRVPASIARGSAGPGPFGSVGLTEVGASKSGASAGSGPTAASIATAARLRAEAQALSHYAGDCSLCAANVFPWREWGIGGCVGFVTLPIERRLEDLWVGFVSQAAARNPQQEPVWLRPLLACQGRDLSGWRSMRGIYTHGEPDYFEYPRAPGCELLPGSGPGVFTTDALCAYLFEVPNEDPAHVNVLGRMGLDFLGHLTTVLPPERLEPIIRGSRSIEEFLEFGNACRRAAELGVPLRVSL